MWVRSQDKHTKDDWLTEPRGFVDGEAQTISGGLKRRNDEGGESNHHAKVH